MRPALVKESLITMIKANRPVMLHGSPGVGKSDVIRQVADELNVKLIDIRLSQLDPVDLRGIPSVTAGKTIWNQPSFLPVDGEGILFLDEINSAPQAVQAAAYQLVLDRRLGEYELPKGWRVMAAGNRTTDRAIVNQMSTALKNRFAHVNYNVNNDDWCDWAIKTNLPIEVIGFIRFRPTMLNEFEQRNNSKEEKDRVAKIKDLNSFATPRSWASLAAVLSTEPKEDVEYELYSGIVGETAATEFMGYLKYYRDLPDLDALLMNPEKTPVPENPAVLYALATGLAAKASEDSMERLMIYTERMPLEFQTLLVKDALARDPKITKTKPFISWMTKNAKVLY